MVNLKTGQITWKPLRGGFLGTYSVENPAVALALAEGVLGMEGDLLLDAQPASVNVSEADGGMLSGALVSGEKIGALVEGAEFVSFDCGE